MAPGPRSDNHHGIASQTRAAAGGADDVASEPAVTSSNDTNHAT
jgi:hypothetical protein